MRLYVILWILGFVAISVHFILQNWISNAIVSNSLEFGLSLTLVGSSFYSASIIPRSGDVFYKTLIWVAFQIILPIMLLVVILLLPSSIHRNLWNNFISVLASQEMHVFIIILAISGLGPIIEDFYINPNVQPQIKWVLISIILVVLVIFISGQYIALLNQEDDPDIEISSLRVILLLLTFVIPINIGSFVAGAQGR